MIKANTEEELERKLREKAHIHFEESLESRSLSKTSIKEMGKQELQAKLIIINEELSSRTFKTIYFKRDKDFRLPEGVAMNLVGWEFDSEPNLIEKRAYLKRLISRRDREEEQKKVFDLVQENVKNEEALGEINNSLKTLENEPEDSGDEQTLLEQIIPATKSKKDIELEHLDKKISIVERLLDREYFATVIGGLLLIVFSIALIEAMFNRTPIYKEIESAFLLILGYFFGQSVTKK